MNGKWALRYMLTKSDFRSPSPWFMVYNLRDRIDCERRLEILVGQYSDKDTKLIAAQAVDPNGNIYELSVPLPAGTS